MKKRRPVVIAIVGRMLSGKETVSGVLAEILTERFSVSRHTFSDVLNDVLTLLHVECDRKNLQKISTSLREMFGENIVTEVVYQRALADAADVIIIDGVRRLPDVEMVRRLGGVLIAVEAPFEVRFERAGLRLRPGEKGKTREEFAREDEGEPERLIESIAKDADFTVLNDGTPEELRNCAKDLLIEMRMLA